MTVTTPPLTMRERVIDAAVTLTTEDGWAAVTMARLADVVGVSRQTVYNEVGSKPLLAEAMILRELDRFLGVVDRRLRRAPRPTWWPRSATRRARCSSCAQDNLLLQAIVSATHGADTELLPLLTTHADVAARDRQGGGGRPGGAVRRRR